MRRARLKDIMNQARIFELMPIGARREEGNILFSCAPGWGFASA